MRRKPREYGALLHRDTGGAPRRQYPAAFLPSRASPLYGLNVSDPTLLRPSPAPPWPHRPALFLDVDGTLLEIAAHPSLAAPSARLRALLPQLPVATAGAVALISGRRIEDLDRILSPHDFIAAGVHGLQRRGHDGCITSCGSDMAPSLARVALALEPLVAAETGLWLEDKRMALALHYRARPDLEAAIHARVGALQAALPSDIEILLGHCVVEFKPCVANKGDAIRAFMHEPPFAGRTPVFLGDDVTDEAGFNTVNALGGVSVKVGPGATAARFRLADVDAVMSWLEDTVGTLAARHEAS